MRHARTARRWFLSLGILVLVAGVFALSVEAKAWVDPSQHHLAKHFKATDSLDNVPAAVVAPAPAIGLERLKAADPEPLPTVEFLPGAEPSLRSHLLRSPPES